MSGGIRDDESLEPRRWRPAAAGSTSAPPRSSSPEWCARAIAEHGDRVAVGLDVRGRTLAARGWTSEGGDLYEVLARLDAEGCARYVVTDVNKDGMLQGPNLDLLRDVCAAHRPAGRRLRRRHHPGGPRGADPGLVADGRRGRDRRHRALRGPLHPGGRARADEGRPGVTLAVRVIPCLDVDAGRVVKGINFQDLRDAGDPVELARTSTTRRAPTS